MLKAYVMDFGGNQGKGLPLIKFVYNNSYQASIQITSFEALYERKCRPPLEQFEVGEVNLLGLDLVQESIYKVQLIRERLVAT